MLFSTVVCVLMFVAFLLFVNKKAVSNMFMALKAQVGELGRAARNADPLAIYKEKIANGLENIEKSKRSLESVSAQVRSLQRQVDEGIKDKTRLENRIKSVLNNGDTNNSAKDYALQLRDVENNLKNNQEQLDRTKTMYENFVKNIEVNQNRIQDARREVKDLGVQLEQSEREKELVRFSSEFSSKVDFGGELAEAREAVKQKIDANKAVGDVALDVSSTSNRELLDDELVRQNEAEDILARFK